MQEEGEKGLIVDVMRFSRLAHLFINLARGSVSLFYVLLPHLFSSLSTPQRHCFFVGMRKRERDLIGLRCEKYVYKIKLQNERMNMISQMRNCEGSGFQKDE